MTSLLTRLSTLAALSVLAFGWTSPVLAGAQDPSDPHFSADPANHVEQSGKVFQIRLIPGAKRTELFVLGKKKGQVNWKDVGVQADFAAPGTDPRLIEFKREEDRFIYEGPLNNGSLHLKVKHPKQAEDFTLKLK